MGGRTVPIAAWMAHAVAKVLAELGCKKCGRPSTYRNTSQMSPILVARQTTHTIRSVNRIKWLLHLAT